MRYKRRPASAPAPAAAAPHALPQDLPQDHRSHLGWGGGGMEGGGEGTASPLAALGELNAQLSAWFL
jgi:hypothetical protein